jgi:hypothetical protein
MALQDKQGIRPETGPRETCHRRQLVRLCAGVSAPWLRDDSVKDNGRVSRRPDRVDLGRRATRSHGAAASGATAWGGLRRSRSL